MTTIQMAQSLAEAKKAFEQNRQFEVYTIVSRLLEEVKQDVAAQAAKSNGAGGQYKAILKFAKHCKKECEKSRPGMAGAFIIDGTQVLCDGYRAFLIEEPFDGLPQASDEYEHPDIRKVFSNTVEKKRISMPALEQLKGERAIEKAEHVPETKKDAFQYIVTLETVDGSMALQVNGDWLIETMEAMGTGWLAYAYKVAERNGWSVSPIEFDGGGIKGLLLPIMPKEERAASSSQDTAQATR